MKNFSSRCVTVTFYVGLGISTYVVPANNYKLVTGYWWAAWLYINNMNAWVDWSSDSSMEAGRRCALFDRARKRWSSSKLRSLTDSTVTVTQSRCCRACSANTSWLAKL